jgi:hypothetical protein
MYLLLVKYFKYQDIYEIYLPGIYWYFPFNF